MLRNTRVARQEESIARLSRGELHPHRETLVETEVVLAPPAIEGPAQPVPARILEDRAERIVIEVDAPTAGLLVLTDTYYPGWVATIDGIPSRIGRANGLHRFVVVAPGRQQVALYRPASLRRGASLSGASCLIILVVIAAAVYRRSSRA